MEKLKKVIEQYGRWSALTIYIERIETYLNSDFSQSIENTKALLETIGKEICSSKGTIFESSSSINAIMKKTFSVIGYSGSHMVTQISTALATIGQQLGDLRNNIGTTSHGRSLEELRKRNQKVDELTREFLIDSAVIVACFLIRTFENENPRVPNPEENKILYENNPEFNDFWDESYGEFEMGEYSYSASEILFNVDIQAYETEVKMYEETPE